MEELKIEGMENGMCYVGKEDKTYQKKESEGEGINPQHILLWISNNAYASYENIKKETSLLDLLDYDHAIKTAEIVNKYGPRKS